MNGRWRDDQGRRADRFLCASAMAVITTLLVMIVVCSRGILYRGGLTLTVAAVSAMLIVLPTLGVARFIERRIQKRRPWYSSDLLDGLWLPRPARLGCWLGLFVGTSVVYAYATRWSPLSPRDARAEQARHARSEYESRFAGASRSPSTVEDRGRDAWLALGAKQAEAYIRGGPAPSFVALPPRPAGPRTPVAPGRPWTDESTDWGIEDTNLLSLGYLPNAAVPTKTTRQDEYQKVREAHEQGDVLLALVTLPLAPVLALIGWGSSTTYADHIMKSTRTVMEGKVLSREELLDLLEEVPRNGLAHWRDQFATIIKKAGEQKKLTDTQIKQFLANLKSAVEEADRRKRAEDSELVKQLVLIVRRELKRKVTPAQIAAKVRSVLTGDYGGRFPSEQFAQDMKSALQPELVNSPTLWDAFYAELKPTGF